MAIFESESNDTLETADALALGSPIVGQLAALPDTDLFVIQASAAGAINVSIDTPTNSGTFDYFSLAFLDASGNVLSLYQTGRDATFTTGVPAAGAYYVSIEAADFHSPNQYELVAAQSARAPGSYETESNDTLASADALAPGSPIIGQLATFQDSDVFAIEAAEAGAITISIDTPTNSSSFDYFTVSLLDDSGNALSLFETGRDATYTTGVPAPGTYYVSVDAADFHDAGPYEVVATLPATDGTPTVTGTPADDLLTVDPGDVVVEAGGGVDTVQVPFLVTEYSLEEQAPGQIVGSYGESALAFNDVEFLEFGSEFRTTIPIEDVVSGEAQDKVHKLGDLYLAFFGRAPDIEGLEFWQEVVIEAGLDLIQVSQLFAQSPEAQGMYPDGVSNREFVRSIYLNAFGREPDQEGWDYWTGVLDATDTDDPGARGAFVGSVILGAYSETSGPRDRDFLSNRHEVSLGYVNRLLEQPGEGKDSAINDLLVLVTDDDSTVAAAENLLDFVFEDPITLTGVMSDQGLVDSFFG